MRKIIYGVIAVFFAVLVVLALLPAEAQDAEARYGYIRIHVRANGNSQAEQDVKYAVKEAITAYLTPKVAECKTREDAYAVIKSNLNGISATADGALRARGFTYGARAELLNEYFPARAYDGVTLDSGYYDALIVYLGSGAGDNWWCVIYPPLCFVNSDYIDNEGIRYKSKLLELIKKATKRN
jgi:stage II sporulation protein R